MSDAAVSITGIGQVSLETRDVERAVEFYRDTLGLTHMYTFPHPTGSMAFFDCDGLRLFISSHEDRPMEKSSVIYFKVDDIQASYAALVGRGVPFEGAPHLINRDESGVEDWMAFFRAPDENLIAVMSQVGRGRKRSSARISSQILQGVFTPCEGIVILGVAG